MNVTQLLHQWHDGQETAFNELVDVIYNELYGRAHRIMRRESSGHTLQTGALVNEAYLRLVDLEHVEWQNRQHFFAVAAKVMRRILVDHARARGSKKRGGDVIHIAFDEFNIRRESPEAASDLNNVDLVALNKALNDLESKDSVQAQIVELRYFAGLPVEEIAIQLSLSTSSVKRKWKLAQAWLYRELYGDQ